MTPTPVLIDRLVAAATPVRRLRRPTVRAASWLLLAAAVIGLLIAGQGIRPDFQRCLRDMNFVAGMMGMLLTGICAAVAAFMLSLPDRPRAWALLPLPGLALWLSTLGYQCLTHWVAFDPSGLRWGETARCFSTVVMASLPLSALALVMLRYAAPLRTRLAPLAAGVAVSAMTAAAMSLIHDLDASIMILMWNIGAGALIVSVGGALGHRMLGWMAARLNVAHG